MRPIWRVGFIAVVACLAAGAIAQSKAQRTPHAQPALQEQATALNARTPIPFHGRLTDSNGAGITAQTSLTFALYRSSNSQSVYWTEQQSVTPQDGWFSVVLGDVSTGGIAFPADWDGSPLWLGVTVQGDAEMTPRTPLLPVPYAAIANPTQHGYTHEYGGTDEIGSTLSANNELVRGNDAGTIDPGWLPMATSSLPGVVTLNTPGNGTSGVISGNDPRLSDSRNPLAHANTHKAGGSDALASSSAAANGIPQAGSNGTLDPAWFPAATNATAGVVTLNPGSGTSGVVTGSDARLSDNRSPLAHANTHKANGTDPIGTATPGANAIPMAGQGGQLDIGWFPTATTAAANKLPLVSGSTGKLDPSWLPGETTSGNGAVQYTPTPHANTHQSGGADAVGTATPTPNAIPYANASGYLDGWINQLAIAHGGTGTASPKITRNLCFFLAGPSSNNNLPTLMVPPGANACYATTLFASAAAAPSSALVYTVARLTSPAGNLFTNTTWSTGLSNSFAPGGVPTLVNANDVLQPVVVSGAVNNATVCVQLTCTYAFQ